MALILLAGLKALPNDLLEAAAVDGRERASKAAQDHPAVDAAVDPARADAAPIDAFRCSTSCSSPRPAAPATPPTRSCCSRSKEGLSFFDIGRASAIANLTLLCIALIAVVFIALIRRADKKANGR